MRKTDFSNSHKIPWRYEPSRCTDMDEESDSSGPLAKCPAFEFEPRTRPRFCILFLLKIKFKKKIKKKKNLRQTNWESRARRWLSRGFGPCSCGWNWRTIGPGPFQIRTHSACTVISYSVPDSGSLHKPRKEKQRPEKQAKKRTSE